MKTPRLTDFDPNAKAPSLKSSLENMPAIQKPHSSNEEVESPTPPLHNRQEETAHKPTLEESVRPYGSTPVREYERPYVPYVRDYSTPNLSAYINLII
jgi:hypothetical protein